MFRDRRDAGGQLAQKVHEFQPDDCVVVGLPRGGVPVAAEVARLLRAPLDVIVVRKLGLPSQPELAMGAVGEGGVRVVDVDLVDRAGVDDAELRSIIARESREVDWRVERFRAGRPPVPLDGRVVVVVDDGVATGSTAMAACRVARGAGAARVVMAVPVAPTGWDERMGDAADRYIAVETHRDFGAVARFYRDFRQVDDADVIECLQAADVEQE